jgi:hypothetical protein
MEILSLKSYANKSSDEKKKNLAGGKLPMMQEMEISDDSVACCYE